MLGGYAATAGLIILWAFPGAFRVLFYTVFFSLFATRDLIGSDQCTHPHTHIIRVLPLTPFRLTLPFVSLTLRLSKQWHSLVSSQTSTPSARPHTSSHGFVSCPPSSLESSPCVSSSPSRITWHTNPLAWLAGYPPPSPACGPNDAPPHRSAPPCAL